MNNRILTRLHHCRLNLKLNLPGLIQHYIPSITEQNYQCSQLNVLRIIFQIQYLSLKYLNFAIYDPNFLIETNPSSIIKLFNISITSISFPLTEFLPDLIFLLIFLRLFLALYFLVLLDMSFVFCESYFSK